jgi:hypothetical protein
LKQVENRKKKKKYLFLFSTLYCFCTAVQRTFFDHHSRCPTGLRRKPICGGFDYKRVLDVLSGEDNPRRDEWIRRWNAIKGELGKIRDRLRIKVPPQIVEDSAAAITKVIYSRIISLQDILWLKTEEVDGTPWADTMIGELMVLEEVKSLVCWLENLLKEAEEAEEKQEDESDVERRRRLCEKATRQLIRSTLHLRMKMIIKADQTLAKNRTKKTFRDTLAVLGCREVPSEIKTEGKGKKKRQV